MMSPYFSNSYQVDDPHPPATSTLSDTVDIAEILHQVNNWIFAIIDLVQDFWTINQSTQPELTFKTWEVWLATNILWIEFDT